MACYCGAAPMMPCGEEGCWHMPPSRPKYWNLSAWLAVGGMRQDTERTPGLIRAFNAEEDPKVWKAAHQL